MNAVCLVVIFADDINLATRPDSYCFDQIFVAVALCDLVAVFVLDDELIVEILPDELFAKVGELAL